MNMTDFSKLLSGAIKEEEVPTIVKGMVLGSALSLAEHFLVNDGDDCGDVYIELMSIVMPMLIFDRASKVQQVSEETHDVLFEVYLHLKRSARVALLKAQQAEKAQQDD